MLTSETPWSGLRPYDLDAELPSTDVVWWVCGGWAIDLFLGRQTRDHADLDIGCFRQDAPWFQGLPEWSGSGAHAGKLHSLAVGDALPLHIDSLWFARVGATTWGFQLMLETRRGADWVFRRDAAITRSVADLWWTIGDGLRVMRPEIQMLYKAKDPRPQDEMDLSNVLPPSRWTPSRRPGRPEVPAVRHACRRC